MLLVSLAIAAEHFEGFAYYLGDPHAHTGISKDAASSDLQGCSSSECGQISTVFETARDNQLDWVAFPEHINGNGPEGYPAADATQYDHFHQRVLAENNPNTGLLTLPAAEVWFTVLDETQTIHSLGHKTLLFFGDNAQLVDLHQQDLQPVGHGAIVNECADIEHWAEGLEQRYGPLLLMPHHPATPIPMPTDWNCYQSRYEPVVEVYSEHGNSLNNNPEYDPCPRGDTLIESTVESAIDPEYYHLKMGFAAGTDSHDTRPGSVCDVDTIRDAEGNGGGLTVVVLPEEQPFNRKNVYAAMMAHATYATTGPLLPVMVSFRAQDRTLGHLGESFTLPEGQNLEVEVTFPESLQPWVRGVELVSPQERWAMQAQADGHYQLEVSDSEVPAYLYAAIEMDGGSVYQNGCDDAGSDDTEWIWVSPSWITRVSGDGDGDGYSGAEGDCNDVNPAISPGRTEIWYDGIDQNCDGNDRDQDGDGWEVGQDCHDGNALIHPEAIEIWYDGIDQNCDHNDWDQDQDGWNQGLDCADTDAQRHPMLADPVDGWDQDCDGWDGPPSAQLVAESQERGGCGSGKAWMLFVLLGPLRIVRKSVANRRDIMHGEA